MQDFCGEVKRTVNCRVEQVTIIMSEEASSLESVPESRGSWEETAGRICISPMEYGYLATIYLPRLILVIKVRTGGTKEL